MVLNFPLLWQDQAAFILGMIFVFDVFFLCIYVVCNCNFYFRGKGDYYRLGHGTDEHIRRPRKVSGLQGKKIVSISTGKPVLLAQYLIAITLIRPLVWWLLISCDLLLGSLHVVVCSNKGEVFAWGDNDEGQLGDGTLKAVPRPRAIPSLQVQYLTKVLHFLFKKLNLILNLMFRIKI